MDESSQTDMCDVGNNQREETIKFASVNRMREYLVRDRLAIVSTYANIIGQLESLLPDLPALQQK